MCDEFGLALLSSPSAPWKGAPLRVIIATEKPLAGELALIAPTGKIAAHSSDMQGGPPYFWFAEIAAPEAGAWQVKLTREGAAPGCRDVTREIVVERNKPRGLGGGKGVWPIRGQWDRASENLYSAWIEILFDAPLDEDLSWKAMSEVLQDQSRNVLFDSLGLHEDEKGRSFNRTAPTFPISCAPISPSRWDCRSVMRSARAATAAWRRDAHNGGTP